MITIFHGSIDLQNVIKKKCDLENIFNDALEPVLRRLFI